MVDPRARMVRRPHRRGIVPGTCDRALRQQCEIDDGLVSHVAPLGWNQGWNHINLTGDYVWHANKRVAQGRLRPLRSTKLTGATRPSVRKSPFRKRDNPTHCRPFDPHTETGRFRSQSPANQICSDCLADVSRQWQFVSLRAFTAHAQTTRTPVDITELERHYFPGAQPQPSKQKHNGIVAKTVSASSIDAG